MTPQSPTAVATERLKEIILRLQYHHEHPVTGQMVLINPDGPVAAEFLSQLPALRSPLQDSQELVERIVDVLLRLPVRDGEHPGSELDGLRLREAARAIAALSAPSPRIVELEARNAELEPQAKELKAIAFQVGEEDDPFAAWEAIKALQARAEAAESALSTAEARALERAAKIADGWLNNFVDLKINHIDARSYASDAVADIRDAIRAEARALSTNEAGE